MLDWYVDKFEKNNCQYSYFFEDPITLLKRLKKYNPRVRREYAMNAEKSRSSLTLVMNLSKFYGFGSFSSFYQFFN
jgi:hypothetical protein